MSVNAKRTNTELKVLQSDKENKYWTGNTSLYQSFHCTKSSNLLSFEYALFYHTVSCRSLTHSIMSNFDSHKVWNGKAP